MSEQLQNNIHPENSIFGIPIPAKLRPWIFIFVVLATTVLCWYFYHNRDVSQSPFQKLQQLTTTETNHFQEQ